MTGAIFLAAASFAALGFIALWASRSLWKARAYQWKARAEQWESCADRHLERILELNEHLDRLAELVPPRDPCTWPASCGYCGSPKLVCEWVNDTAGPRAIWHCYGCGGYTR